MANNFQIVDKNGNVQTLITTDTTGNNVQLPHHQLDDGTNTQLSASKANLNAQPGAQNAMMTMAPGDTIISSSSNGTTVASAVMPTLAGATPVVKGIAITVAQDATGASALGAFTLVQGTTTLGAWNINVTISPYQTPAPIVIPNLNIANLSATTPITLASAASATHVLQTVQIWGTYTK